MGRPSVRPTSLRQQLTRAAMLTTFFAILLSAGALLVYELAVYRQAWQAQIARWPALRSELVLADGVEQLELEKNLLINLQTQLLLMMIEIQL